MKIICKWNYETGETKVKFKNLISDISGLDFLQDSFCEVMEKYNQTLRCNDYDVPFVGEKESSIITENQRLRNELIKIRRLEYVIPNAPGDDLILRAVAMARNALIGGK